MSNFCLVFVELLLCEQLLQFLNNEIFGNLKTFMYKNKEYDAKKPSNHEIPLPYGRPHYLYLFLRPDPTERLDSRR